MCIHYPKRIDGMNVTILNFKKGKRVHNILYSLKMNSRLIKHKNLILKKRYKNTQYSAGSPTICFRLAILIVL